jgi:ketosteroid isomerase-like protein
MQLVLLAVIATFAIPGFVVGQSAKQKGALETEIRRLDHAEAEGLLHKDVPALEQLWAEDLTVNNPRNGITNGRQGVVAFIRDGSIDYSSFVRDIETILFHGDTVIVMGMETVQPVGKAAFAGQTVRRRYTHFWMKRKGRWLLTARHANVICPN